MGTLKRYEEADKHSVERAGGSEQAIAHVCCGKSNGNSDDMELTDVDNSCKKCSGERNKRRKVVV